MANINYVSEHEAFMRYASENGLSGRERLLWIALFHAANQRAKLGADGYVWPEDYFTVSNAELTLNSGLDKRGIEAVRIQLQERGLVLFTPGNRRKDMPAYRILYLTGDAFGDKNAPKAADIGYKNVPNPAPDGTDKGGFGYKIDPKEAPIGYKNVPKAAPSNDSNSIDIYNNINNNKDNVIVVVKELEKDYEEAVGEPMSRFTEKLVAGYAKNCGMEAALLHKAVELTGMARKPSAVYLIAILNDWSRKGYRTLEDRDAGERRRQQAENPALRYDQREYKADDFGEGFFLDVSQYANETTGRTAGG